MKKQPLYTILIIISACILFLFFQFFNQNDEKNGFRRNIKDQDIEFVQAFKLPLGSFYFAGFSNNELYLRTLRDNSDFFSLDYSLIELKKHQIKSQPITDNQKTTIGVLDTVIFITDNQSGELLTISRSNGQQKKFKGPQMMFKHTSLLSKQSIVGKSTVLVNEQLQRQFTKYNYNKNKIEEIYKIDTKNEGFFPTDGMLKLAPESPQLLYIYFYKGEFLSLDTNLKLLYKSKTIDTVRTAKVYTKEINKVASNEKKSIWTQSKPPIVVNRGFTIYRNRIYIMSALKADNEDFIDFKNNQVIDVYELNNGKYLHSFYFSKYKRKRPKEFKITEEFIFAIYENALVKYKIKNNYANLL